jgi:hypothetical protein
VPPAAIPTMMGCDDARQQAKFAHLVIEEADREWVTSGVGALVLQQAQDGPEMWMDWENVRADGCSQAI